MATIGRSQKAENAFRPMMRAYELGTDVQRRDLDDDLARFVEAHPRDPLIRLALVLRAFNALDRGDLHEAERLARSPQRPEALSPLRGPRGTPRDLATVVVGAAERRRGRYEAALTHLEPLVHKMIDGFATARLNEELVLAALGAQRWHDAIGFMEVWRSEAEPGHERPIERRIKELLTDVPKAQLLASLRRRTSGDAPDRGLEMTKLVAQQLAVYAVWDRDSALARLLVDEHGPLLGRYGEAAARLAVDTTRGRVLPRTVGILLPLDAPTLRRRSTDTVTGMSIGLGLPGSDARLVTRDAGGEAGAIRQALAELAGEGAAVVVAGLDPDHSAEAAHYARDNSMPVVLLTPDPESLAGISPFVFELGPRPADTTGALVEALEREGHSRVGAIGEPIATDVLSTLGASLACQPMPSSETLEAAGVEALVVRDGAYCGAKLFDRARSAGLSLALGLGPATLDAPPGTLALSAGAYPVDRDDPRLSSWFSHRTDPPSWWAGLGHDAAVLALEAVRDLETTDTDVEQVQARRLEATSALTLARGTLWTTGAPGFGGAQVMPREIAIIRGGDDR